MHSKRLVAVLSSAIALGAATQAAGNPGIPTKFTATCSGATVTLTDFPPYAPEHLDYTLTDQGGVVLAAGFTETRLTDASGDVSWTIPYTALTTVAPVVTGRFTWLPYAGDKGRSAVQVATGAVPCVVPVPTVPTIPPVVAPASAAVQEAVPGGPPAVPVIPPLTGRLGTAVTFNPSRRPTEVVVIRRGCTKGGSVRQGQVREAGRWVRAKAGAHPVRVVTIVCRREPKVAG